jgi:hypothetical protein
MVVAFTTRSSYGRELTPRRKPGEQEAEAKLILLGTYRVYTWSVWISVVTAVIGLVSQWHAPGWVRWPAVGANVLELGLAHALYWRLGYDWRRWLLIAGHFSGVVALAECYYAITLDIAEQTEPANDGLGV